MKVIDSRKDIACFYTLCAMSLWLIALKESATVRIEDTTLLTGINVTFALLPISACLFAAIKLCRYLYLKSKYGITIIDYRPQWQMVAFDTLGLLLALNALFSMLFRYEPTELQNIVALLIVPLIALRFIVQVLYGFVLVKPK